MNNCKNIKKKSEIIYKKLYENIQKFCVNSTNKKKKKIINVENIKKKFKFCAFKTEIN